MESGDSNTVTENQTRKNLVKANNVTPSEKELTPSSSSNHGKPNDGGSSSTTDNVNVPSPATDDVMAKEESSTPRIPSSVFERSDTATPAEWSVASNESLFSIHMGNMSFTKEQLNCMYKSGELGYPCDTYGSPLRDLPNNNNHKKSAETGVVKASDLDGASMKRMVKDDNSNNAAQEDSKQPVFLRNASDNIGSLSQHSDVSFAFPILAAGGDSCCHKFGSSMIPEKVPTHCSQPSNPKVAATTETTLSSSEPPTPPDPDPVPHNEEQSPPPPPNKPASHNCGQVRWFSWFSCCASR